MRVECVVDAAQDVELTPDRERGRELHPRRAVVAAEHVGREAELTAEEQEIRTDAERGVLEAGAELDHAEALAELRREALAIVDDLAARVAAGARCVGELVAVRTEAGALELDEIELVVARLDLGGRVHAERARVVVRLDAPAEERLESVKARGRFLQVLGRRRDVIAELRIVHELAERALPVVAARFVD